jgi:5-methylcytosine-specific restriction endonuclease McrA
MRFRAGGELTIKTIQQVYEDNIKQYGTLTCYLCVLPIVFGADNLEHKIPLSRGGTNEYKNLGVACSKCNRKKHNKTEEEFKKGVQNFK